MKTKLNHNRGITLIALVITIIVLLILAAVSIAMLTGDNGILTQANKAKAQTERAEAKERAQMDIMKWQAEQMEKNQPSDLNDKTIEEILKNSKEKGYGDYIGTINTSSFTTSKGNYEIPYSELYQAIKEEEEKKPLNSITGEEATNTTAQDKFGNKVIVPEGFKVLNPDDNVTDGIMIQDVNPTRETKGSEFVWIPVGTIYTNLEKTQSETIELNRYTFANDELGTSTPQDNKPIIINELENVQELTVSEKGNIVAKNIEAFKTSVKENGGYYIGRHEAKDKDTTTERTDASSDDNQITVTPNNFVYTCVTQPQAANLGRNMYQSNYFISDLMNSYAWDTAVVFLQKFDNRKNKVKPYSYQNSLNTTLAPKGTNQLTEETKQDKICNVYDMASNIFEWTTETGFNPERPTEAAVPRGGLFDASYTSPSFHGVDEPTFNFFSRGFRVILYLE